MNNLTITSQTKGVSKEMETKYIKENARKQRDFEWSVFRAQKASEKSERLANFAVGFSVFTLVFILVVELLIKK